MESHPVVVFSGTHFEVGKGEHCDPGPKPKYGAKIDVCKMDADYLKETSIEDNLHTDIYLGRLHEYQRNRSDQRRQSILFHGQFQLCVIATIPTTKSCVHNWRRY
jgi:hypothetical protein